MLIAYVHVAMMLMRRMSAPISALLLVQFLFFGNGAPCPVYRDARGGHSAHAMAGVASRGHGSGGTTQDRAPDSKRHCDDPCGRHDCQPVLPGSCSSAGSCALSAMPSGNLALSLAVSATRLAPPFNPLALPDPTPLPDVPPPRA